MMSFKKMSADEALEKGVITKGKWYEPDEWEYEEPDWRRALQMAGEYHKKAGHTYVDKTKELRSGEERPYVEYIQKLLDILINEVHMYGDEILTVAALYGSLKYTDLTADVIEKEFDADIRYMVSTLKEREGEALSDRIDRCMENERYGIIISVLLSELLLRERVSDRCPFDSYEKDILYYKELIQVLEKWINGTFSERKMNIAIVLVEKILKTINQNITLSLNCNKTTEELFSGWED